jgi:hypothetical protein
MTTFSANADFSRRWCEALERFETTKRRDFPERSYWEGYEAFKELKRRRRLLGVCELLNYPVWFREIEIYRRFAENVLNANVAFRKAFHALVQAERLILKTSKKVAILPVRHHLVRLSEHVASVRATLERDREGYWERALSASPDERAGWSINLDSDEVEMIPPQDLIESEKIFASANYRRRLIKRSDLDKRFQVRMAVVLRRSLPTISLETISRLVVLCYICADFAEEREVKKLVDGKQVAMRQLVIKQLVEETDRHELTVGAVCDKLRKSGLH